jgi:hypothetical protein
LYHSTDIRAIEEGRGSGGALVEVKQSAEAFGFVNGPFATNRWLVRERDDILKSLMISLLVKVTQILIERVVEGTFAEKNQLVETLLLD